MFPLPKMDEAFNRLANELYEKENESNQSRREAGQLDASLPRIQAETSPEHSSGDS